MADVMLVLQIAVLVTAVYAFVHAAMQRPDAYTAAEKLTKPVWLVILGGAVALTSILSFVFGGARHGHRRLRGRRVPGRRAAQAPRNPGEVTLAG